MKDWPGSAIFRAAAGASILAFCAACSSGPGSMVCTDLPMPGIIAAFDAYSIVFPGDHVTAIELCDAYKCGVYLFDQGIRQALGPFYGHHLWIPFDTKTDIIRDLTVTVLAGGRWIPNDTYVISPLTSTVLAGGRVIRTARAPGVFVLPKSTHSTNPANPCGQIGLIIHYNPRTGHLYGVQI